MVSLIPVGPGARVTLLFTLRLESGDEIDTTGNKPAVFTVGDGSLLPGFERAMFGLKAGDRKTLPIVADDGFGVHNADNVQRMPRTNFAEDIELEAGLIVSFADQQKSELPGVVIDVSETMVEVDFNHPLAGKDLEFEVEILDVEQVSNEIARARH
jgi:FKBP-type peptidyl-prolyl cis-trans isomerase SlpA